MTEKITQLNLSVMINSFWVIKLINSIALFFLITFSDKMNPNFTLISTISLKYFFGELVVSIIILD